MEIDVSCKESLRAGFVQIEEPAVVVKVVEMLKVDDGVGVMVTVHIQCEIQAVRADYDILQPLPDADERLREAAQGGCPAHPGN